MTSIIVSQFVSHFEGTDKEFTLIEMKKILEDIYKANSKSNKNKVKREPSAYNNFMKEQMQKFKNSNSELNAKDRMKKIADMWKAKENLIEEEPKKENPIEEEPKKKRVVNKK